MVRWSLSLLAETETSVGASAACYRRLKHVAVHAVIVLELKFSDIQRHIFGAHLVERADHAAFEDRPEIFDRVGVDRASAGRFSPFGPRGILLQPVLLAAKHIPCWMLTRFKLFGVGKWQSDGWELLFPAIE